VSLERPTNRREDTVDIFQHLVIPDPDHTVAVMCKLGTAGRVGIDSCGVLTTVDFNHELAGRAGAVGDVSADRELAPETPGEVCFTQHAPQRLFRISGVASESSSNSGLGA
jgi:hypothetical protein